MQRLFADWSTGDMRDRYRLRQPHRLLLDRTLGESWFEQPTRALAVAFLLGHGFTNAAADLERVAPRETFRRAGVTSAARSFLDEVSNPPPILGQMTTMAAVRRWSGGFWYVGRPDKIDVFGSTPQPRRVELPARVELALNQARDEDELRIAAVSWRGHRGKDLVMDATAKPGTFALTGLQTAFPTAVFEAVLDALTEHEVHLAVLPEVMVSPEELAIVQGMLAERGRRWPVLLVVGVSHHARTTGGFANVALVLDSHGREVMRHEKLEPFSITRPDGTWSPEDIVPRESDVYHFADTPIGRLAVNICRDVRSDVPMLLNRCLGITLLLVPAYSNRLDFAAEEAQILGSRQQALTVAVNPPLLDTTPNEPKSNPSAYLYVPIMGQAGQQLVPGLHTRTPNPQATTRALIWQISRQGQAGKLATVADVIV
ncbi:MAG: hypothetical protein H6722_35690 [Sandaracinus sp.]|nr:hypothetical protein [Sandaracinus sp.]